MNKISIIILSIIFIVLIFLKVNFLWIALLAVAGSYFIRQYFQNKKSSEDDAD